MKVVNQRCASCNSPKVTERFVWSNFEYGTGDSAVRLRVVKPEPVTTCSHCNVSFTDYRSEAIRAETVAQYRRAFAPRKIMPWLDTFDLPTREFCATRIACGTASALERFVYKHEPLRPGLEYAPDEEFRRALQDALLEERAEWACELPQD